MRPSSFDAEWQSDWSLWVIDHGLPDLPARIDEEQTVPIARWVGRDCGAVLHVRRFGDDEDTFDELDSDVELLRRDGAMWSVPGGSGGTGWCDPPFERPDMPPRSAQLWGEVGSGSGGWSCCAVYGIAGSAVAAIELIDNAGVTREGIESPFGAFVACASGPDPATLRILDHDGEMVLIDTFGGLSGDGGYGMTR